MQGIRTAMRLGMIGLTFLIAACASTSTFTTYNKDMAAGKQFLRMGDYNAARTDFLKAAETGNRPEALAFAATASYKASDFPTAGRYIAEAERTGRLDYSYFRVTGYKALVLLQEGKKEEALKALGEYVKAYRSSYGSTTLQDVEYMWKRGNVDLPKLEKLIEQQVTEYEDAVDWYYRTGTGSFDKKGGKS